MQPIRLMRGFLTVGSWTFVSRLVGFLRDVMMAAYLGAGPVAEAFLIAFSLPNMFRRFFAEGAFNMAFVPMFSKKLESGEDAQGFARDALTSRLTKVQLPTVRKPRIRRMGCMLHPVRQAALPGQAAGVDAAAGARGADQLSARSAPSVMACRSLRSSASCRDFVCSFKPNISLT
jgi:hypothetical protein